MSYNKFFAKKVTVDGMKFDSIAEARRWRTLTWLQRGGVIKDLQRQVKYIVIPAQYDENHHMIESSMSYIADFVYCDENGKLVVEDVKGYKKGPAYQLFAAKRKLMLERYGIRVVEINGQR